MKQGKQDFRKKMKLAIEFTPNDLKLFEDFLHYIPLCSKHNGMDFDRENERRLMTMYYECKGCEKVWDKWRQAALRIESRLWREAEKKWE